MPAQVVERRLLGLAGDAAQCLAHEVPPIGRLHDACRLKLGRLLRLPPVALGALLHRVRVRVSLLHGVGVRVRARARARARARVSALSLPLRSVRMSLRSFRSLKCRCTCVAALESSRLRKKLGKPPSRER